MARTLFTTVWLASLAGCIIVEAEPDTPDSGTPDPEVPDPTPPGDDSVLPAVLSDGPVTLVDRVEDPALPDYTAPEGVDVEVELTVEPGVVIAFGTDTILLIDGRAGGSISAVGTDKAPIQFTSPTQDPGAWGGVYVDNSESSRNRLDFVSIEYAGGQEFGAGLGASALGVGGFVGEAEIEVSNSTIRNSASLGIELEPGSRLLGFEGNTFGSNAGFDLSIPAEELGSIAPSNRVSPQGIRIVGGDVESDATWADLGQPVRIDDEVVVGAALTIDPGVRLEFGDNVPLIVDGRAGGSLAAVGTDVAPIELVNQDGVNWKGLWIDNSEASRNALRFVDFVGGGFSAFERDTPAQLTIGGFVGTSSIVVEDCTFTSTPADAFSIALQDDATVNDDIETANTLDRGLATF